MVSPVLSKAAALDLWFKEIKFLSREQIEFELLEINPEN